MTLIRIKADFVILLIASLAWPVNSLRAHSGIEADLHRVRKIFLETKPNGDLSEQGMAAFRRLHAVLTQALLGYGFTVVDSVADSDAMMYGGNTKEWVVLDGPQVDPPKHGFQFWLSSSKYNFKWQTEFDINSRADESELGRKAAQKAAGNLFKAWKRSATRAGVAVGDRLP